MKSLAIAALTLAVLPRAFALFGVGDVVYDPVNNGVLVETKIETLAQWATALPRRRPRSKTSSSRSRGRSSLSTPKTRSDWGSATGKASSPRPRASQLQAQNLTKDNNQGISASFVVTTGQPTLGYTNHGNFDAVPTTDAFGNPVTVSDDSLKRYAAVEAVYEKALTTLQSTETEAQQNNQEIADTYQQMTQAGITQQEYEKLRGKIQTLSVRQQALQAQRQDAFSMIQAEQTINQNQKTKEDAVTGQAQESAQEAVVNGVSQTQFDVLSWQ